MRSHKFGVTSQAASSDEEASDALLDARIVRERLRAAVWITATVVLVAPLRVAGPGVGLDPGWAAGLNLGRAAGMRYGRELMFTYGPWGFLDVPLALNRFDFALGLSFSVVSTVVFWLVVKESLRSKFPVRLAYPAVSILTFILASASSPSALLAAATAVACIRHLRQSSAFSSAWCPVVCAGLGALLLQIKFSEGVAVTFFAGMTSLASPRSRLVRTAASGVSWLVTSLVLCVLATQSIFDIGPWLSGSLEFVAGYSSAMSADKFVPVATISLYLVALLLSLAILILGQGQFSDRRRVSHTGSLLVTAGVLLFGFKQTFTRQSPEHNAAYFAIAALLLCLLLEWGPKWRATVMLIALATLIAGPGLSTYTRGPPGESWVSAVRVLTSDASRAALLDQARAEDEAEYDLPKTIVQATQGHPVSVDPWEVSMVWAYSMKWRPMPVFQNYSAYTAGLDQLNADAARLASDDQMMIRATTVSTLQRPTVIDDRNPMWDSPRYTLALVCNYSMVNADARWMLLRKSFNRCGAASAVTIVRKVFAHEPVRVPSATTNEIVVFNFFPTKATALESLERLVTKEFEPLLVSVDGKVFRLPEGLASGPLVAVLPAVVRWPAEFRGQTSARSISFSRTGMVQFRTVHVGR